MFREIDFCALIPDSWSGYAYSKPGFCLAHSLKGFRGIKPCAARPFYSTTLDRAHRQPTSSYRIPLCPRTDSDLVTALRMVIARQMPRPIYWPLCGRKKTKAPHPLEPRPDPVVTAHQVKTYFYRQAISLDKHFYLWHH